jgi:UDP-N-acetyl-2-amino-2-deoxyglucuronate dehydrogenase
MDQKVSIGVIGCGGAAWIGHLPWIWDHPGAVLVAACDPNLDRAKDVQQRYGVDVVTGAYEEVLKRDDIDAVCICTPPASHCEIAVRAAENKKHVLIEKPMARSVVECDRMIAAAQRHGVLLMVGHEKRFSLACQRIKQILQERSLGEVFYLAVHWGSAVKLAPESLIPSGYRESYEWRWKDEGVGGGILQDHLPHYVDLWRWWTDSEVETVCAEIQNVTRDYLRNPEIGVWEDFGTVLMRFKNGAVGSFNTGTVGRGFSPLLHLGSGLGEWSEFGYLFGTGGQLTFDFFPWDSPEHGRVMVWSLEGKRPADRGWYQVEMPDPLRCPGGPRSPKTNESYMFRKQMDHFVRAIRQGVEPEVTGSDGRKTLAVVEAAYESQRIGQKVRVSS